MGHCLSFINRNAVWISYVGTEYFTIPPTVGIYKLMEGFFERNDSLDFVDELFIM